LNNVFVLIFLFGLVSFVFQKLRGGNQGSGRGENRMPPFGQGPAWGEMRMPRPQRREREGWPAPSAQPVPSNAPGAPAEARETRSDSLLIDADSALRETPETPRVMPAAATAVDPQRQRRSPASAFGRTGASSAVQGMMWAEVFGAPRSKKPHTTRR
jgi:hypothetical protein